MACVPRNALQRFEFRRALAAADRAGDRNVGQLSGFADASQHQSAAAHIAAADEVFGEMKPVSEYVQEQVNIFPAGDTSQENDFAVAVHCAENE